MQKRNIIIIISILAFITIAGGISYSYFVYNKDVGDITLNTGEISISLSNVNGNQTLSNIVPVSDFNGQNSSNYFDFTVDATVDTEPILYEIEIIPESSNTLDNEYVKLYLTDQNNNVIVEPFKYSELYDAINNNGKVLYQSLLVGNNDKSTKNYSEKYRLRLWVDENCTEITSNTFAFDINIYAFNVNANDYVKTTFNVDDRRELNKYVKVNEEYGSMPTPVRDGYTFMGWNGKNIFDEQSIFMAIQDASYENGYYVFSSQKAYILYNGNLSGNGFPLNNFDSSKQYTISYTGYGEDGKQFLVQATYSDGTYTNVVCNSSTERNYSFTTTLGKTISVIGIRFNTAPMVHIKDFQLEEGTTATAYEPYYVTSDVSVTQEVDHTLKAIWQENE